MLRRALTVIAIIAITAAVASAASPGKIESIGALNDSAASAAVKTALESNGYRLTLYDGSVVDLWFAKSIAASKEKSPNAVYPQLGRSTFLGVISFQRSAKDFRGQSIRSGAYAMRFELLPSDGNHMGVAAQPDFILLTPLVADTDPNATYDFAKLVELSAKAADTAHPASFSLVPTDDVTAYPSLFYTSDGYVGFAAKLKADSGDLPLAVVVKGVAQQ